MAIRSDIFDPVYAWDHIYQQTPHPPWKNIQNHVVYSISPYFDAFIIYFGPNLWWVSWENELVNASDIPVPPKILELRPNIRLNCSSTEAVMEMDLATGPPLVHQWSRRMPSPSMTLEPIRMGCRIFPRDCIRPHLLNDNLGPTRLGGWIHSHRQDCLLTIHEPGESRLKRLIHWPRGTHLHLAMEDWKGRIWAVISDSSKIFIASDLDVPNKLSEHPYILWSR